jgi:type III secretion protein U
MSTKNEAPTTRRLEDARQKGEFARSNPATAVASVAASLVACGWIAPRAAGWTVEWAQAAWSLRMTPSEVASGAIPVAAAWIAPPLLAAWCGTLVAGFAQAGFLLTPGLLAPDGRRISPTAGVKRLFSAQRLFSLIRACVLLGISTLIVAGILRDGASVLLVWPRSRWDVGLVAWGDVAGEGRTTFLFVLAVFSAVDWALAEWRHRREMRMSRDEVRREQRESEGDLLVKGQRRALHRALVGAAVARGVRSANVVVVNPTHIAVGLRYAPDEADAPFIVARAREDEALALREEAKRIGIPVVRNIPLARSLVVLGPGEEVPEELYKAAAAVLGISRGAV